jgi:flagellar hook protein FlgE
MTAKTTSEVQFTGNLDADSEEGATAAATMMVYDTQGTGHAMTITFTKTSTQNNWTYEIVPPDGVTISSGESGELTFTASGTIDTENSTIPLMLIDPGNGAIIGEDLDDSADSTEVSLDFSNAIQFASAKSDILAQYQNGFPMGVLENFSIGVDGLITGTFTNGMNKELGQIALGTFGNPAGLLKAGGTTFKQSNNSGELHYSPPAFGATGSLVSGSLEMANVDLSREFTNMIITQRGFQANSRIISTSDEMLQELVNLKR